MKLSNIISTSLLETDDDMFPGTDSSVFDDTRVKDQSEHDMNDLGWIKDQLVKFKNVEQFYLLRRRQILVNMDKNGARVYIGPNDPPDPNVIRYSSYDWFDDSTLSAGLGKHHGIEKSSSYLKDIENTVRKLDGLYKRESFFRGKKIEMENMFRSYAKREKIRRSETP